MAQVTIELRHLLELENFELFDFEYEFDDRKVAKELEQAVIDEFYFYEIGQETPDQFKHVFKRRWLSVIGYVNELHNTTLLKYNPLSNYKMSEFMEQLRKTNGSQTITTEGTAKADSTRTDEQITNTDLSEQTSDYPQQNISNGDFLDGAREQETSTTNRGTATTEEIATNRDESNQVRSDLENMEYEKTIEGITGITYQDLIRKERENIIRLRGIVIEELKPCFILVH